MGRLLAIAALVAVAGLGCKTKERVPSPSPAFTPPLAYRADVLARARVREPRLLHFADGLVLDAGFYLYRIDDARVARVGDTAAYAAVLPEAADLVGYDAVDATFHVIDRRGSAARPPLLVRQDAETSRSFAWDGNAFTSAAAGGDRNRELQWTEQPPRTPPAVRWQAERLIGRGRVAWLGEIWHGETEEREPVIVVAEGAALTVTHPLHAFGGEKRSGACTLLPSADGRAYARCDAFSPGSHTRLLRLDGDRWVVADPDDAGAAARVTAIDAEGGRWSVAYEPLRLVRVAPDGVETTLDVPLAGLPRSPGYRICRPQAVKRAGALGTYVHGRVDADETELTPDTVREIEAMGDSAVYLVVELSDASSAVVRVARRPPAPPPTAIPTPADQVTEARNTRPLRSWAGPCPQVFVAVPAALGEEAGTRALDAAVATFAKLPEEERPQAALVEGRLGGARVRGLVILRPDLDVRAEAVDAAVIAAIGAVAAAPAPPPPTCSLPVIERVVRATSAIRSG